MDEYQLIAKTFQGLEEVLAKELTQLGANNVQIGRRMVSFTGDKAMMYKANFCLRTAIRILKPIKTFKAANADEVYEEARKVEWDEYMDNKTSFAVDAVVYSEEFRHSMFVAYRIKDAIADYFREKTGERPSVQINNPDITFHIHISQEQCTLALDSSGESLHRRGYRQETGEAPLNEVLAAGMILLSGWEGDCDFIDPMCGSGTLPIEAAMIACNISPGIFRKNYAFENWTDFDKELLNSIYEDDSQEREFVHKIYGYDNNPKALGKAIRNVSAASMGKHIELKLQELKDFQQPAERAIMITNPPYGERLSSDNLLDLYKLLGERLKHAFEGNVAWIISLQDECFDQIGLKASARMPLFNGPLACEYCKYELFSGKYNDFRENGDALQKEEFKGKPRSSSRHRDDDDKPRSSFRRRDDDDKPRSSFRRRDDDDKPRSSSRRRDDDDKPRSSFRRRNDDDKPRSSFRRRDDDDKPRSSFRRRDDDDKPRSSFRRRDDDDKPRSSFRRRDDDDKPRSSFRRRDDDDKPRSSFRRRDDDDKPRSSFRRSNDDKPRSSSRRREDDDKPRSSFRRSDDRPRDSKRGSSADRPKRRFGTAGDKRPYKRKDTSNKNEE